MSTCDQIEAEACLVHDTVADNAPSCDAPATADVATDEVANVTTEEVTLTEEQSDALLVLEEVPEEVCHTVDVGGISHQDASEAPESLVAEVVLGEEHSCKVVELDASPVTESVTKSTMDEVESISVEVCIEDHAHGEEQASKVAETASEIPTPQQQRKLARLAQMGGKEKEIFTEKVSQSTVVDGDVDSSTIHNEAFASKANETQDIVHPSANALAASSSKEEVATKARKLNSKQRKARARRLEAEKASASVAVDSVEKDSNTSPSDTNSPVTVATMGTEETVPKRKKLTSSERRARKLAQEAEKSTEVVPVLSADDAALTEEPAPTQNTEHDVAVTKTKKLSGKQRKARKRAAEAAQAAATLAGLAGTVSVAGAPVTAAVVVDSTPVVAAVSQDEGTNSAPLRKKLTSTERRAKRDAKLVTEETAPAVIDPPVSVAVTTAQATTAAKVASTNDETEDPPKAKKLSSKQRKAARRARERAEAEQMAAAAAAGAPATTSKPDAPKPVTPAQVPVAKNAPKPTNSAKKASSTEVTHPRITTVWSPDQSIALHATLTVLRQGLLSRDSVIYTQQGAMKMHLLTELCKLGYPCIEGSAASFQEITWCATNQCLTYTTAIVNAPHQYPSALRAKGELKIATPGLSVQLKCYPTFGAGSPALMGRKNFRNGFVRHFEEVAVRETDSFVFVLPAGVYTQFARDAVMSLPAAQNILQHLSRHVVMYVNKTQEEIRLTGVFCSVETLYGEFIVGSVMLA